MTRNDLGIYLEELRGKMSLREASRRSGLSHTYIRDLEMGVNRGTKTSIKPSTESLKTLADIYNVPLEKLLEKAGYIEETKIVSNELRKLIERFNKLEEDDQDVILTKMDKFLKVLEEEI